jgi:hypothetical protein
MSGRVPTKRTRLSCTVVRVWAWIAGAMSFVAPFGLLGLSPRPAGGATAAPTSATAAMPGHQGRPVVIVLTKRIVYTKAASSSVTTSSSGSIGYNYAPVAPAPAATTCGTHAC